MSGGEDTRRGRARKGARRQRAARYCRRRGARASWYDGRFVTRSTRMCRNIRTLANFEPPATDDEIRASALQFVRKLSGTTARRVPESWRRLALALLVLLVCQLGAHVAMPWLDPRALGERFRTGGVGLLAIYDWIVAGGLSRGAVLALGVMPWLSATLLV